MKRASRKAGWVPGAQDVMCVVCSGIATNSDDGRPRLYCDNACRQKAWRLRRAAERAQGAGDEGGGVVDVETTGTP